MLAEQKVTLGAVRGLITGRTGRSFKSLRVGFSGIGIGVPLGNLALICMPD